MAERRGIPPTLDELRLLANAGKTINQIVRARSLSSDKKLRDIAKQDAALYEQFKANGKINQAHQNKPKIF